MWERFPLIRTFYRIVLIVLLGTAPAGAAEKSPEAVTPNSLYVTPNPCIVGPSGDCAVRATWEADALDAGDQTQIWAGDPATDTFALVSCAPASQAVTQSVGGVAERRLSEIRLYRTQGCPNAPPAETPLASVTVTGVTNGPTFPAPSVGPNKIDLLQQYLGRASRGNGAARFIDIESRMGRKAIVDAARTGAKFMRVAITGYAPSWFGAPSDLALWRSDPTAHWTRVDAMMNDLHDNGMGVLASFVFNTRQFPAIAHEKIADMFRSSRSESYRLLTQYVSQFIDRYRSHPALYAYEIGNETTLIPEFDYIGRCNRRAPGPLCDTLSHITTNEMIGFTTRLASFIRAQDPTRPIMSGFSLPRIDAANLRAAPPWSGDHAPQTVDTPKQFEQNLREVNQGVDVITMHYYLSQNVSYMREFGAHAQTDPFMIDITKRVADSLGKKLYIGEFGDNTRESAAEAEHDPPYPFSSNVLKQVVALGIPYSSPWIWEYYELSLDRAQSFGHADSISLEPGFTDGFIKKIAAANRALGHTPRMGPSTPVVIVVKPLAGDRFATNQEQVFAVASDDQAVVRVDLVIDESATTSLTRPPYRFSVDAEAMNGGAHVVAVRAYDADGHYGEARLNIRDGRVTETLQ